MTQLFIILCKTQLLYAVLVLAKFHHWLGVYLFSQFKALAYLKHFITSKDWLKTLNIFVQKMHTSLRSIVRMYLNSTVLFIIYPPFITSVSPCIWFWIPQVSLSTLVFASLAYNTIHSWLQQKHCKKITSKWMNRCLTRMTYVSFIYSENTY